MPHHRTERGPCNRMDRNIPSGTMGKGVTTMELDSWFVSDDPVAAVDPADLRSVWTMGRNVQANAPGQQLPLASAALSALAALEQILKRSGIALRCCKCWPDRWGCSHPGCAMANSPMSCSRWLRPSL